MVIQTDVKGGDEGNPTSSLLGVLTVSGGRVVSMEHIVTGLTKGTVGTGTMRSDPSRGPDPGVVSTEWEWTSEVNHHRDVKRAHLEGLFTVRKTVTVVSSWVGT